MRVRIKRAGVRYIKRTTRTIASAAVTRTSASKTLATIESPKILYNGMCICNMRVQNHNPNVQ